MLRTFDARHFPPERVLEAKRSQRVSVCIPARNEEATIGPVVETIVLELQDHHPVVDELVVVDDGSSDDTAAVAEKAGAAVVCTGQVLTDYGTDHGKGQAMWLGTHVTSGDIVVYLDADVTSFHAGYVLGLVGPLVGHHDIDYVKGFYTRPFEGRDGEGGRVTELAARPLITLLFPDLAPVVQPLAGEYAGRRDVLEAVPFVCGYGIDLGLLIDVAGRHGTSAMAQCDLGRRVHRNRPLAELGPQALAVMQLGLQRAGLADGATGPATLIRPPANPVTVTLSERPPLRDVPAHRKTA